jgi:hypothetical protein
MAKKTTDELMTFEQFARSREAGMALADRFRQLCLEQNVTLGASMIAGALIVAYSALEGEVPAEDVMALMRHLMGPIGKARG